jgi:hypothetical protein
MVMTSFRDNVLAKSFPGRQMISLYYFCSSRIVEKAASSAWLDRMVRRAGLFFIPHIVSRIEKYQSQFKK